MKPARPVSVGFALTSEHSSFHAALGLARVLKDRGHDPVFFVNEATVFAPMVRMHGYRLATLPPGHDAHRARPSPLASWRVVERLRRRARRIGDEQAFLRDAIRCNALDLCFLDAVRYDLYPFALALARAGVPALLLSYTFASRARCDYAPVFSSVPCRATARPALHTRVGHALRWTWAVASRGHRTAFGRGEYARMVLAKALEQVRNASFERELRSLGLRSVWSEWKRRPDLPEVVFGHRALDWPAAAGDPARHYLGATDRFRDETPFDASRLDPLRPVVYANLSTINGFQDIFATDGTRGRARPDLARPRFRIALRYVEGLVACFARRPEWQLLLACGPFLEQLKDAGAPPNVHLHERLPQLAVLARADLAVTWGGAGTIRECINLGVPMVVLPAWTDQFGNAARVAAANVGVRGDLAGLTPATLAGLVERGLGDPGIRASIRAMRAQCDPVQEVEALVRFVAERTGVALPDLRGAAGPAGDGSAHARLGPGR